jgi:hypothetical protein
VARVGERGPEALPTAKASAASPLALGRGPAPAQALALQRLAGNRAAARVLARWTKHPDAEKKGVMVPDVVAVEFEHFNPPKNA